MPRTDCGASVVLAMKQRRHQKGQAVIEYAFLMVLLATIGFAVIALAGNQITGLYQEVSYELTHITDATTLAPDGTTVSPGATPGTSSCPAGKTLELRGHKWKCK
jgi:Flp pilus assembly pilin Flp